MRWTRTAATQRLNSPGCWLLEKVQWNNRSRRTAEYQNSTYNRTNGAPQVRPEGDPVPDGFIVPAVNACTEPQPRAIICPEEKALEINQKKTTPRARNGRPNIERHRNVSRKGRIERGSAEIGPRRQARLLKDRLACHITHSEFNRVQNSKGAPMRDKILIVASVFWRVR